MNFVIYGTDALITLISNGLAGSRDGHEQSQGLLCTTYKLHVLISRRISLHCHIKYT